MPLPPLDPIDPAAAHAAFRGRTRFGNLDGLRALCIGAVLWHHAPVWTGLADPPQILSRGFLGVDFFFVLSGFLITTLLLRERDRDGGISLPGFYLRRARRILPPYILVVSFVAAYLILWKGETRHLEALPYYFVFLANFLVDPIPLLSPMWSLAVEEQYYFLWPILVVLLPLRALLPVLGVMIAANVAGILGALAPLGIAAFDAGPLRFALPASTYAPILIGSAGAVAIHGTVGFAFAHRLLGHRLAPLLAMAVLAASIAFSPQDVRGWPNLGFHLLMLAALLSLVVRERTMLTPLLAAGPIARIGELSYGIYLYHLLALHVVHLGLDRLGLSDTWLVLVVYVGLSILMAEASFRSLESYFRRPRPATQAA